MKVNFKQNFVDCFGNPITEKKSGQEVPLEIWERLARSLFNLSVLGGAPVPPDEKYTAYSLSRRIAQNPSKVELSTEEASFLKRVSSELLSAGAYGLICDIIEGK